MRQYLLKTTYRDTTYLFSTFYKTRTSRAEQVHNLTAIKDAPVEPA